MAKRKPLEEQIEDEVIDLAEAAGWIRRKLKYADRRGAPDRMFYKFWNEYQRARVVFIEFKRPGGVISGLQAKEHKLMKERGVEAYIIDNVDEAKVVLGL